MNRVNQIVKNPIFMDCLEKINNAEEERIFCRHSLEHSLDVARILYIMVLERNLPFAKDIIYATALLHDIGRCSQYEKNIPHHEAGVIVSERILKACGYSESEILLITEAIKAHQKQEDLPDSLNALLYQADKQSRTCYSCEASSKCYWSEEKKNKEIIY